MKVTLLGTGDAIGMPAPMCDCKYCKNSEKRRRPGLLIETEEATVVLDISPDIKEQLQETETYDVDAFFVTHFHADHFSGIREIHHMALSDEDHAFNPEDLGYNGYHGRTLKIYGNQKTKEYLDENLSHIGSNENVNFHLFERGDSTEIGNLEIEVFGIQHGVEKDRKVNQGYTVVEDGKKIVYAPDAWKLKESEAYKDADIMFIEGQLFKMEGHANQEVLEEQIETADPDRVVLLNITEHLEQTSTEELKKAAEEKGYEIWSDFDSVEI